MYLIGSIGLDTQSAVTLYIYRVGKTYPARNHVYRSKSIRFPNCTRTPHGPVRPIGPTSETDRALAGSATAPDRSDRLVRPVRLVTINFGHQHIGWIIRASCLSLELLINRKFFNIRTWLVAKPITGSKCSIQTVGGSGKETSKD